MNHAVTCTLALVCTTAIPLIAQPVTFQRTAETRQVETPYGCLVPGLLPPPPDPMDAAGSWARSLGLDAGQQASLNTILEDLQNSSDALHAELDQARSTLVAAAKSGTSESEIERLAGDLGALLARAVALQATAYSRFYALLTPDQKQRFDRMSDLPQGALTIMRPRGGQPTTVKR
jgi:Spy/CpxP family protein refolding chaperone